MVIVLRSPVSVEDAPVLESVLESKLESEFKGLVQLASPAIAARLSPNTVAMQKLTFLRLTCLPSCFTGYC